MRPAIIVSAAGRDITDVVRDRFVSATVTDEAAETADTFELVLDDRPPGIAVPPTGAELAVDLGFREQGTAPMGTYTVDEIEQQGPPDTMTIRAQAADVLGELKAPRTRSWSMHTIGDVVGTIAGRHDLTPRVDTALSGIALPHIDQADESDLSLLRRLASYQLDVVAKVANGQLLFLRRQVLANELAAAATRIPRTDAVDYRVLQAERGKYAAVVARWREFEIGELQEVTAGSGTPVYALPETYPDRASASNAAETKLRALQRGTRTGKLTLSPGRPELAADAPIRLDGWGGGADGVWVANAARHTVSEDGYRTTLDIEAVTEPWERAPWEPRPEDPFAGAGPSLGRAATDLAGSGVPGAGGGGGSGAAGTSAPNMMHVAERVAAEDPAALRQWSWSRAYVDQVVAALRAVGGPRWGYHRNDDGSISTGSVAYYRGDGDPVEGSTDIAVRAIVQGMPPGTVSPSWADLTFLGGSWAER